MIEPTYEDLRRFSQANEHYRRQHDHGGDIKAELIGFYQWMRERWGIQIYSAGHRVPPRYLVTDPHQYLLFILRWS